MTDTQAEKPKRGRCQGNLRADGTPRRTSTYTEAKGRQIIAAVLDGKTTRGIAQMGLCSTETLNKWLKTHTEFSERYAEAKFLQVVGRLDEVIDIADDTSISVEDRKLMVGARQWLTGRLLPAIVNHPYLAPPARTSAAELAKLIEGKDEEPAPEVKVIEPDDELDRTLQSWRNGESKGP